MHAGAKKRRAAGALGAAAAAHLLVLALWQGGGSSSSALSEPAEAPLVLASVALLDMPSTARSVELAADSLVGAADHLATVSGEAPQNSSSAPGQELGRRAPGSAGEQLFSTRADQSYRSTTLWNGPGSNQMQRATTLRPGLRSPEALERAAQPDFGERKAQPRQAQKGQDKHQNGLATSEGQGGAPGLEGVEWFAMDPRFDTAPSQSSKARSGALRPSAQAALTERGAASSENAKRGPAGESLNAPGRSNRKTPGAFDLGAPSAGGAEGLGAGGRNGRSTAANAKTGSAALTGSGQAQNLASTRASRSNPYFLKMYKRIDAQLRFPKKLALALEQGDLVLRFQLDPSGRVRELAIDKRSGFREFDEEAVRAFRAAAPFGKVPPSLLRGREGLAVIAPYYFRNPLIR